MEKPVRVNSFSYMRAIACAAIVILHTAYASVVVYGEGLPEVPYLASRAAEYGMMWAVPCFIMVTGALLLDRDKEITLQRLFRRYILRVLAALVVFCLVLRLVGMAIEGETFRLSVLADGLYQMVTGTSWSYMWYLYLLIGLYLLLPFYKKIASYSTDRELRYLLAVYLIFQAVLPLTQLWGLQLGFYIHVSTIYPFYLFCGYMIHADILRIRKGTAALLAAGGTVAVAVLTVIRWRYQWEAMDLLIGYASVFVILQAIGIFALVDKVRLPGLAWLKHLLLRIDACSFGIYLIHMIFIRVLLIVFHFNPYTLPGPLGVLLLAATAGILSYLVTWILKKIPVVRGIV